MEALLRDHAVQHVWCSPEQDNQTILAAQRITRPYGEKISFPIMTRRLNLPTKDVRYHVFQIGQVHPHLLGLLPHRPIWALGEWISMGEAVDHLPLFADVYTDKGVHIPLFRVHYLYTPDRALIFAVELQHQKGVDFEAEQIYLRLYTNAYYQSREGSGSQRRTRYFGNIVYRIQDINVFQTQIAALQPYGGYSFCFVNGRLVETINPFTCKAGDAVEVIFDESVKRIVDFKVEDLKSFTSELDDAYKYLLHPPKSSDPQIDYLDDVDFYILRKRDGKMWGHYYHRNLKSAVRMVTHQDYSLRVDHFTHIAQSLLSYLDEPSLDLRELTIRAIIRNSGLKRPLFFDRYRVFELYKLNDEQIIQAMVGVDAVVPFWTASALESSAYSKLMGVQHYSQIDAALLKEAYGYNAITKVLADTPTKPSVSGALILAELPPGLQNDTTFFEYDQHGLLLGYHYHAAGTHYQARSNQTRLIEGVVGRGGSETSVYYGVNNLPWQPQYGNRLYRKYMVSNEEQGQWEDVTDTDYYRIENGLVIWNIPDDNQWLMLRTDRRFLVYSLDLKETSGQLYFDLIEVVNGQTKLLPVPLGELDVWLNRHALIHELDYHVQFPRVYITCKEHLVQPARTMVQKIVVRYTGFSKDLTVQHAEDYGFIEHGVLSNNSRFDVRDDKNLRITINGSVRHSSDLTFSELHQGVSVVNPINGAPYQVRDLVSPIRGISLYDTFKLRQEAVEIDNVVENYMTLKLPEPERPAVSTIPKRYLLVSPFFSKLVSDLYFKRIPVEALAEVETQTDVENICQPYLHLLEVDPIQTLSEDEHRFVVIHPTNLMTPVGLNLYQYRFVQRAIELYGRNRIQTSPHLVVNLGG